MITKAVFTKGYSFFVKYDLAKKIFDVTFSFFALIIFSPLFLIIALLILLTSKGPIFYLSTSIGQGGKIIRCIKFRTMHKDARAVLPRLLKQDMLLLEEWKKYHKLKNDPRVTTVGKFLRRTSLDELPQFINVLKGDLSVVGPRVLAVTASEYYLQELQKHFGEKIFYKILSIKPGITGIWQISGRSDLSIKERIKLEEKYVDQRSFGKDLIIILKTIPQMVFSKGAY